MRTEPVQGTYVGNAASLAEDTSWIVRMSDVHAAEALAALAFTIESRRPFELIDRDSFPLPTLGPVLDTIIDGIEGGRGIALLRGVPIAGLASDELELLFRGLACHIGYPEPQDVSGKTLHHVRAEQAFGDNESASAAFREDGRLRGYQTNIELQFHGDGSDALLFMCRNAGKAGGLSRIVSAGTAFNAVLARDPELAVALQRDFVFDARGELGPDRPWQIAPIYIECAGQLSILYKRGYIDLAQRLPGVAPMTTAQRTALDALDAALTDPANYYEFRMEPGDIQIANNYNILHARTAFEDHREPEKKRHMLRVWATLRRNRRPLPEPLKSTREFAASHRRRVSLGDAQLTC